VTIPISGEVLSYQALDDADPGYAGSAGMATVGSSIAYRGDVSFNQVAGDFATYTFTGLTPGQYYVAFTWLDDGTASQVETFSDATPFTVLDGATPIFSSTLNHEFSPTNAPGGANFLGNIFVEGRTWQAYAPGGFLNVTGTTVTVRIDENLTDLDLGRLILADGVLLFQVTAVPGGNSEGGEGGGEAAMLADSSGGGSSLRMDDSSDALDSALLGTTYWDNDLEDMAAVLAADDNREDQYDDVPVSNLAGHEELEAALTDWLE
jgi:hypothetical protein